MVAETTGYDPEALEPNCPVGRVLGLVADKWTVSIVFALAKGTKRHGELRREVDGVSQKVMTRTLRALEGEGLVECRVHPIVPPMVEYALTPRGRTLIGPLEELRRWAEGVAGEDAADA